MPSWLANILVLSCIAFIFLTLLSIACIKFSYRIRAREELIKELEKENKHKNDLLNAYGIKEITCGGEDNG